MGQLADTFSTPASGADAKLPFGAFWVGTGGDRVLIVPLSGLVTHSCPHADGPFVPVNGDNGLALNL